MSRRKGSKKKVTAASVSKPAKYVVSPASPVKTRSKSSKTEENEPFVRVDVGAEELAGSAAPPLSSQKPKLPKASSSGASEIKDLEERWDTRFARMETAIRSGLSQQSCAAASTLESVPSPSPAATVAVPTSVKKTSKTSKTKKKKRTRTPSPPPSDSEGSESESDSSDSSSESDSDSESGAKSKKKKKGKYDAKKFLDEGDKIDSFERLMLANLRMAAKLLKKERNITGLLQHLILLVEKADSGMFASDCLCRYDEAVHLTANEKGLRSFAKIDPATIFRFLTYDGTVAAEKAKRSAEVGRKSGRGRSSVMYSCYAYNYDTDGCKGGCGYRHICCSCGSQAHIFGACPSKKPSGGRHRQK